MTLAEQIRPKLSDWRPAGDGRHTWAETVPDHGWAVRLTVDKADTIGCLVWELGVTRTAEPPSGFAIRDWAERIATRSTGLTEPLTVHEIDESRGEAILRSATPARQGDVRVYYEVRLNGQTTATLHRYQVGTTPGDRREQVAFALSHEVLAKVAGDLAG